MQKTEVTREKYDYAFDVLPPIYISHINGLLVHHGFAVMEPLTHTSHGAAVVSVYWMEENRCFCTSCTLMDKHGQRVFYTDLFTYRTVKAFTHE